MYNTEIHKSKQKFCLKDKKSYVFKNQKCLKRRTPSLKGL